MIFLLLLISSNELRQELIASNILIMSQCQTKDHPFYTVGCSLLEYFLFYLFITVITLLFPFISVKGNVTLFSSSLRI